MSVGPVRTKLQNIQRRLYHYISQETANCAGLSQADLQAIIAGTYIPNAAEQDALSRRMKLESHQYPNTLAA